MIILHRDVMVQYQNRELNQNEKNWIQYIHKTVNPAVDLFTHSRFSYIKYSLMDSSVI